MDTSIYLYIVKMAGSRNQGASELFFKWTLYALWCHLVGEWPIAWWNSIRIQYPSNHVCWICLHFCNTFPGIKHGLLENSLFSSMMFPVPRCVRDFPARHVQCPEGITIIFNMKTLLWLSTFGPIKSDETSTMSPLCLLTNVNIYIYILLFEVKPANGKQL